MSKETKRLYDAVYYQGLTQEQLRVRYERNKIWQSNNPERLKQFQKNYYERKREEKREYNRKYKKSLPIFVYRWISPEGYTAYVGRGTRYRINSHKKRSQWFESNMFVRTLKARNEWHAMRLEGLWGELFQPRYNKDGYRR